MCKINFAHNKKAMYEVQIKVYSAEFRQERKKNRYSKTKRARWAEKRKDGSYRRRRVEGERKRFDACMIVRFLGRFICL